MNSIVGFSLIYRLPAQKKVAALEGQNRVLDSFKHLQKHSIKLGETQLDLWGHGNLNDRIHSLPDGSRLALIGSPIGKTTFTDAAIDILQDESKFQLPWDGRVILLKISADGKSWTLWNDWLGSIPVFYADVENGRLASTLEPVTVAGAGFTSNDFFLPGLVSLLINGHPLSHWTLYKGMSAIPADSICTWDERGFEAKRLWTVEPSQSRWETGWDDLVDEMYAVSRQAIAEALSMHPKWNIPLSSGLDSRLIAGVAASVGADATAYAWGGKNATDVNYSRQIAKTLGLPWKHIELPPDFLKTYTPHWLAMFGSSITVHGMYQMSFLDILKTQSDAPITSGLIGDTLSGDVVSDVGETRMLKSPQLNPEWYSLWIVETLQSAAKFPLAEALEFVARDLDAQEEAYPGARFQKYNYLELWNRQRYFTSFSATLLDYWNGVGVPFVNRAYARFFMSLPRAALDHRRLLRDVFKRYYGPLAVIPGTYAHEPYILTGRYLILRRLAKLLPQALHVGPLRGFGNVQLRMNFDSIQAMGRSALWPLFEQSDRISEWLDMDYLERDFQTVMKSRDDVRPLTRLQAAQTLAYRLIPSLNNGDKL